MSALIEFFNSAIGHNTAGAVALAFIVYIITQFILAHFKHQEDRRSYQYERSSATGRVRFEKESLYIEQLSSDLLCLISVTKALELNSVPLDSQRSIPPEEKNAVFVDSDTLAGRWLDAYSECEKNLGAAAPFLNYLDLETGSLVCGVREERRDARGVCSEDLYNEQLRNHIDSDNPKSLYLRAALLMDSCAKAANKYIPIKTGSILGLDELDETKDSVPSDDGAACAGHNVMSRCAPGSSCLAQAMTKNVQKESNLSDRYGHFVNCAYCRLRACETGSRDARRQRAKAWFWRLPKWLFSPIYHYFDAPCPYWSQPSSTGRQRRSDESCDRHQARNRDGNGYVRMVIALIAVPVVVISLCFGVSQSAWGAEGQGVTSWLCPVILALFPVIALFSVWLAERDPRRKKEEKQSVDKECCTEQDKEM